MTNTQFIVHWNTVLFIPKDDELEYSISFILISLVYVYDFMLLGLTNLYLASDIVVFFYWIAGDEMTRIIWKYIKDKVISHFLDVNGII